MGEKKLLKFMTFICLKIKTTWIGIVWNPRFILVKVGITTDSTTRKESMGLLLNQELKK